MARERVRPLSSRQFAEGEYGSPDSKGGVEMRGGYYERGEQQFPEVRDPGLSDFPEPDYDNPTPFHQGVLFDRTTASGLADDPIDANRQLREDKVNTLFKGWRNKKGHNWSEGDKWYTEPLASGPGSSNPTLASPGNRFSGPATKLYESGVPLTHLSEEAERGTKFRRLKNPGGRTAGNYNPSAGKEVYPKGSYQTRRKPPVISIEAGGGSSTIVHEMGHANHIKGASLGEAGYRGFGPSAQLEGVADGYADRYTDLHDQTPDREFPPITGEWGYAREFGLPKEGGPIRGGRELGDSGRVMPTNAAGYAVLREGVRSTGEVPALRSPQSYAPMGNTDMSGSHFQTEQFADVRAASQRVKEQNDDYAAGESIAGLSPAMGHKGKHGTSFTNTGYIPPGQRGQQRLF